jgi:hypothetical protein
MPTALVRGANINYEPLGDRWCMIGGTAAPAIALGLAAGNRLCLQMAMRRIQRPADADNGWLRSALDRRASSPELLAHVLAFAATLVTA